MSVFIHGPATFFSVTRLWLVNVRSKFPHPGGGALVMRQDQGGTLLRDRLYACFLCFLPPPSPAEGEPLPPRSVRSGQRGPGSLQGAAGTAGPRPATLSHTEGELQHGGRRMDGGMEG